ncbi:MAG: hypothetical protein P1V51_19465 [Deltaproteobacteria bacterium]|nr:hypothetical protein [Deltaproteobacteria bacterium]
MFNAQFERLADWATSEVFRDELQAARERFFGATGEVHEEDAAFESRMSAFSEYYLFDYVLGLDHQGRRPVERFLEEQGETLTTEDRAILRGLCNTRNGLFEVRKLRDSDLRVRDLLTGEDLEVHERRRLAGVEKGDLVQTRLVPFREHLIFGRAFIYHPREVRRLLLKTAKRRRKAGELAEPRDRERFLALLARTVLNLERQRGRNLAPPNPTKIYGMALE